MTRCRIPEFCEWYEIDLGNYDIENKKTTI